ncbi:MAG: glycosyltransferase family 2 protein [Paracoccus sp. (in: a-proteobacteria)]|uniref:glycosyltransferase family 2 protein n=1 Tax=Paracoccus sp. TaxID=267 RepID=UPI0026E10EBD|nr:glycosyltransferase family 2 protein [Paracoccus sp. (in: a-proteobacteria)]MDO5622589.1 glycosyltransferase family 2 protein [Paracoccus sp. (in: a-proteobacteria)]
MRTIVTTMRDEAPFVLEWLAYHQEIGFTDFLIFSNDCSDGTDLMLDRLAAMGVVRHLPNARRGVKTVQWQALTRAMNQREVKRADWVMVSDVDEFLCIHAGAGRLDDLFAVAPDAQAFSVSWRMFGNAGVARLSDAPVLRQFTRCAPERMLWPWRAVQYKTLFRMTENVARLGVHRPRWAAPLAEDTWLDGSGRVVRAHGGTVILHDAPRYDLAQLNHYALGSVEDFVLKTLRGKPNHSHDPIDLSYWLDRNFNMAEDRRIMRLMDAVEARMQVFLHDPELAMLHRRALDWRRARIAELLTQSEPFYLFARAMQAGSTQVLPLDQQMMLTHGLMRMRAAEAKRNAEAAQPAKPDKGTTDV